MAHMLKQRPPRRSQPPASGRPAGLKLTAQNQEAICQALTDYQRLFADCFYRREQRHWSAVYLCGQLSNVERKTIEPMLLDLLGPDRNAVRAVQEFIGAGQWAATNLIRRHQAVVARSLGHPRGVVIVDGSGFRNRASTRQVSLGNIVGCWARSRIAKRRVRRVPQSAGLHVSERSLYLPEDWFDREHHARWREWHSR